MSRRSTARLLLACSVAAGPAYIVIGLAQILVHDGFDGRRPALIRLSNAWPLSLLEGLPDGTTTLNFRHLYGTEAGREANCGGVQASVEEGLLVRQGAKRGFHSFHTRP